MRITTDGQDPFAWLARRAARLPGARRVERALASRRTARRWVWFVAIYGVSVIVFGAVALFLNAIVPK